MSEKIVGVVLEREVAIQLRDSISDLPQILPREQMVPFAGNCEPGSEALEGKVAIVLREDVINSLREGRETYDDIRELHEALLMTVGL